ncbi:MAG: hypothetical protein HC867_02000 [Bacteroidia bacterium]|nr:hypothetical protein [Bacteroidia bacterium]
MSGWLFDPQSDTTSKLYYAIKSWQGISLVEKDTVSLREDLEKGRITAIINIQKTPCPLHRSTSFI